MERQFLLNSCPACISLLFSLFLLFGCGTKTTVVLLPDADGKVGALTVSNTAGSVDIGKAHHATYISGAQSPPSVPKIMEKEEIEAVFFQALSSQPKPPIHFLLYFIRDSNKLRGDSFDSLASIIQTIEDRNSVDISIVGHTDTLGSERYNYTLSKKRAESVARLFIERGVKPDSIKTTSHGEANLLIVTEDNVSEPKNRRVEVVIR